MSRMLVVGQMFSTPTKSKTSIDGGVAEVRTVKSVILSSSSRGVGLRPEVNAARSANTDRAPSFRRSLANGRETSALDRPVYQERSGVEEPAS